MKIVARESTEKKAKQASTLSSLEKADKENKSRIHKLEKGLQKERVDRKAISVCLDQDKLIDLMETVGRLKRITEAAIVKNCAMTEILFLSRNSAEATAKAAGWIYRNLDAPDEAWLVNEHLALSEWMTLVDKGQDIWDRAGTVGAKTNASGVRLAH